MTPDRWVDANGWSLRYRWLPGEGPITVLLHEMGGCLDSWDGVVAVLPGRATLAYDARGAGLSEKPVGRFSIDDLVEDLHALLGALGMDEPVVLAGCAVGSGVAIRFAARYPARVAGLVLLAPATGVAPPARAGTLALAERLEREGMRARVLERFENNYPPRYFAQEADRAAVRGRLLANDPHSYAEMYRMLCAADLADDLARITAPTTVCAGVHDRTRPPERMQEVAAAIPGARFVVIDAGHTVHIHAPAAVAAEIVAVASVQQSSSDRHG